MGLVSGFFRPPPPPPPQSSGGGNTTGNANQGGGTGQTGDAGRTNGASQTGGAGATGGNAQTGTGTGTGIGTGSGDSNGSAGNAGTGSSSDAPPASGSSASSNPVAPRRTLSFVPVKSEEPATLRREDVVTGQERLDLAFAGSLTDEQARRYAEVGRLTVITQQQFDSLDAAEAGAKLAEGVATVRDFDREEEAPRFERRV